MSSYLRWIWASVQRDRCQVLQSVGKPTVALHWLVDSNRLKCFEFLWSGFLHQSCWESFIMDFRIAFLCEFSKNDAQIRQRYEDIPRAHVMRKLSKIIIWRYIILPTTHWQKMQYSYPFLKDFPLIRHFRIFLIFRVLECPYIPCFKIFNFFRVLKYSIHSIF